MKGVVSLGGRVKIDSGAALENAVVMNGCRIGREAVITGAVIGKNCKIGEKVVLTGGAVLGDNTVLPPYTRI